MLNYLKIYCFICVLYNMEENNLFSEIKENEYDSNKFIYLLKVESKWSLLFSEDKYYFL